MVRLPHLPARRAGGRPRARGVGGGANEDATSSKTGATRSERAGEGKRRLSLDTSVQQNDMRLPLRLAYPILPKHRLADSRLAGEDECTRGLLDVSEERRDPPSSSSRPMTAFVIQPPPFKADRELGPGADAELAVDAREVRLDRADAHEELGGDLLVRAAPARELRDAMLGLGQLVGERAAPADPLELRRAPSPPRGALPAPRRSRAPARAPPAPPASAAPAGAPVPRQSSVRPRSSGNGAASANDRSNADSAPARSPSAARSSPPQRAAPARAYGLPRRSACSPYGSR